MHTETPRLPMRREPRPTTTPQTPHIQLDQHAPVGLQAELWERMIALDGVQEGRSGVSAPSSRALHLRQDLADGPRQAFFAGTEFAHLHGDGSGSMHLSLPLDVVEQLFAAGWGEQHPIVKLGGPPNWVMLFGPRDQAELDVVWGLVQASYAFARGEEVAVG
ncbi:hypothetical protein J2Y69_002221 [Microbacterium resistens]|uniref:Luciferase domain-containing protein n=1 Tax=Microbacterium resistens TaxID=156977 RepID=A0ABU1SDF3_9MICO|nr:luciferase family protein [Microbacterium resistens]MDR6867617.1 hypothetical protein [Microbacterium resistens]